MTEPHLIEAITPDYLSGQLQAAGYRVNATEQNGIVQLLSASQGIGYAVRFGNPAREQGAYLDYTFSCALRIQGELPIGLAERWNATRRFARLSVQGGFLVMEMDVVAAGVSAGYLRGTLELWDRLLQEFVVYLRDFSQNAKGLEAQGAADTVEPEAELEEAQGSEA